MNHEKLKHEITQLHSELNANGGIMPPSWIPCANLLITVLTIARPFLPKNVQAIIDILIAAIKAAE